MPAGRSSSGPPLGSYGAPVGHPAQGPPPGYSHPGQMPMHYPGYPPPGGYDPRIGSYGPPPSGYGAPPPGYAPPPAAAQPPSGHSPQPGPVSTGSPGDFARERPDAYNLFEQMAVHPGPAGGTEVRLADGMCRDKHVSDFLKCLKCWLWHHQGIPSMGGRPWRIRCLDLSRNGLSDSSAIQVFEELRRMDLRIEHLRLAGNGIEATAFAKLSEYVWNCQDTLTELDLSHNQVEADANGPVPGSDAISAFLRCLYNHASYPRILTAPNGVQQVSPLTLYMGGNRVKEPARLLKNIQAKGGKKHIQIRPSAEPYDHVGTEYLSVCLPHFLEQAVVDAKPSKEKKDKKEKNKKDRKRSRSDPKGQAQPRVRLTPAKEVPKGKKEKKEKSRREKGHAPKNGEPDHWKASPPRASSEDSNKRKRREQAKKPRREAVSSPAHRSSESADAPSPAKKPDSGVGSNLALVLTEKEQSDLQQEVGEKLVSVGGLSNEESTREMLSEFAVCMAVAGKGKEEIHKELEVFLGPEAVAFAEWFTTYIQQWKRR